MAHCILSVSIYGYIAMKILKLCTFSDYIDYIKKTVQAASSLLAN